MQRIVSAKSSGPLNIPVPQPEALKPIVHFLHEELGRWGLFYQPQQPQRRLVEPVPALKPRHAYGPSSYFPSSYPEALSAPPDDPRYSPVQVVSTLCNDYTNHVPDSYPLLPVHHPDDSMDTDELQSSSDSEDSIDGTELSIDDLPYLSPQEASPTERRPAGCIKLRRNKDGRRYYTRDRAAHLKAHDHPAPRKAWAAWEKQVAETGLSRYLEAIGTDLPSFQRLGYNEQRPALEDVWELIKVSLARNRRTVDGFKMWGAKRWGLKTTRNRK